MTIAEGQVIDGTEVLPVGRTSPIGLNPDGSVALAGVGSVGLASESTLGKVLWGQSGSTAPTSVADPNGVKLSVATNAAAQSYSGAALDGANVAAGALTAPHNVSVTTAVHSGSYRTGAGYPILVTGTEYYTGATVTEALLLTQANGGETISGVVLFAAAALTIAVPGQVDALGHFEFGTGTSAAGTQHAIVDSSALPAGAATEATVATLATQTTLAAVLAKFTDALAITNVRSALGTWTPATAAAPADSAVIRNAACKVGRVFAVNSHATITYYLQLFDSATVPADATAPRLPSIPLVPGQAVVIDFGGATFANGLSWSDSTTIATKTIAATTPFQVSAEIL